MNPLVNYQAYALAQDQENDITDYIQVRKQCMQQLKQIWNNLEVTENDQKQSVSDISLKSQKCWQDAVDQSQLIQEEIEIDTQNGFQEVRKIQEQMGEGLSSPTCLKGSVSFGEKSLKQQHAYVLELLQQWRQRKEQRHQQFKTIMQTIEMLQQKLDIPTSMYLSVDAKFDLSAANLDFLSLELDKLNQTKTRRELKIQSLFSELRNISNEVGEDYIEIILGIHPSLSIYRDSSQGHKYNSDVDKNISLSESIIEQLIVKIKEVEHLKMYRHQRCMEIQDTLESMWQALNIIKEDIERGVHTRILEGPTRLHQSSLQKCEEEIQRLEQQKSLLLRTLIDKKKQSLYSLCEETKLPVPNLQPLFDQINESEDQSPTNANTRAISDILTKLVKMVAEVQNLKEKRASLLSHVAAVEQSKEEVVWLNEYENDPQRFKGREANRKLQRSIKVAKIREKLPEQIKRLIDQIQEYEKQEGQMFVYENKLYVDEDLKPFLESLNIQAANKKIGKGSNKENSGIPPQTPKTADRNKLRTQNDTYNFHNGKINTGGHMFGTPRSAAKLRAKTPTQMDAEPDLQILDRTNSYTMLNQNLMDKFSELKTHSNGLFTVPSEMGAYQQTSRPQQQTQSRLNPLQDKLDSIMNRQNTPPRNLYYQGTPQSYQKQPVRNLQVQLGQYNGQF